MVFFCSFLKRGRFFNSNFLLYNKKNLSIFLEQLVVEPLPLSALHLFNEVDSATIPILLVAVKGILIYIFLLKRWKRLPFKTCHNWMLFPETLWPQKVEVREAYFVRYYCPSSFQASVKTAIAVAMRSCEKPSIR